MSAEAREHRHAAQVSRLFSRFFKHVESLPAFLLRILAESDKHNVDACLGAWRLLRKRQAALASAAQAGRPSTSQSALVDAAVYLEDALVCSNADVPADLDIVKPWLVNGNGDDGGINLHIEQIVEEAQAFHMRAVAKQKSAASNMLTLGMRETDETCADQRPHKMLAGVATTCTFVNPYPAQILMRQEWRTLVEHLGTKVLRFLLRSTSLFVPNQKSSPNLVQCLGQPLSNLAELSHSRQEQNCAVAPDVAKRRRLRKRRLDTVAQFGDSDTASDQTKRPLKRVRSDDLARGQRVKSRQLRKPADVALMRQRIFFARPQSAKRGIMGFPPDHIMNISKSGREVRKRTDARRKDERSQQRHAQFLAKHIWPLEYGLQSSLIAFTSSNPKAPQTLFDDYVARRREIQEKGTLRTPKRLQKAVHLVEIMLKKHQHLDYRRLLDATCRRALPRRNLTDEMRHDIVESLCEVQPSQRFPREAPLTQGQVFSQRPMSCVGDGVSLQSDEKPRFTKYKAPQTCVSLFAQLVLRSIVPIELVGSQANLKVLLRAVDRFIKLRRFETLNLHQVLQGFCTTDCVWTLPNSRRALDQRPTAAESQYRQRLVHEMIYFIFDSLLISLLRTTFYATESARFRNRVLYFRQDDWSTISKPILDCLKEECFEVVPKHKAVAIMSRRDFGYSYVRLLPKEVGMRPIVNLRRRSTKVIRQVQAPGKPGTSKDKAATGWGQVVRQRNSINNILAVLFRVLSYEKVVDSELVNSSISGPQDIHAKLLQYKSRLLDHFGACLPQLYCVKVDIAGAFDCIDQQKLMKIVEDLVRHDRYFVQKFVQVILRGDQASKKWTSIARPDTAQQDFASLVSQLSTEGCLKGAVFSDLVTTVQSERERLVCLLREHISNNLVKIGQQYCVQRVGIPQGSTLSTMLCSFYLGKMEQELGLRGDTGQASNGHDLLMRYTDDFLFLSPDRARAHRFLELMQLGQQDFNCYTAPGKTVVSFDIDPLLFSNEMQESQAFVADVVSATVLQTPVVSWCSYLINLADLSVSHDLSRQAWTSVADTLTVPNRAPHAAFLARIVSGTVLRRNLPIFLDVRLNDTRTVLSNIHQSFALGGLKLISAARTLQHTSMRGRDAAAKKQAKARTDRYMSTFILGEVEHAYAHARARLSRTLEGAAQEPFASDVTPPSTRTWPIERDAFVYLAIHALVKVFELRPSMKHTKTRELLRVKMANLDRSRHRNYSDEHHIPLATLRDAAQTSWVESRKVLCTLVLI